MQNNNNNSNASEDLIQIESIDSEQLSPLEQIKKLVQDYDKELRGNSEQFNRRTFSVSDPVREQITNHQLATRVNIILNNIYDEKNVEILKNISEYLISEIKHDTPEFTHPKSNKLK